MTSSEADVVVVGAGMAGVCCAAELLREGLNPVLVSETPEVGWSLRAVKIGNSRGYVQHPMWGASIGGGSWYQAARFLNAPVSFHVSPPLHLMFKSTGAVTEMSYCPSAAAVVDVFEKLSPMPLGEHREAVENIIHAGLSLTWEQLAGMNRMPLKAMLDASGAGPGLGAVMFSLAANIAETTPDVAEEHMSAYGVITMVRTLLCGESPPTAPIPDPWEGLMLPLARGLEAKGCTILRSAKVADVIIEDGRAVGVALQNGDEVRGRAVALAVGTARVPKIMSSMPEEVSAAVDYTLGFKAHDCCTYALLDADVVPIRNITMVAGDQGESLAYVFPMHHVSPGSTEDGKYLIASQASFTDDQYAEMGGDAAAAEHLFDLQNELFPGFHDATVERTTQTHIHGLLGPLTHGPKLPAQSADIPGLYFAGEGSSPMYSMGVEGAGQAGTLRARQIAVDLRAAVQAAPVAG